MQVARKDTFFFFRLLLPQFNIDFLCLIRDGSKTFVSPLSFVLQKAYAIWTMEFFSSPHSVVFVEQKK